MGFEMGRPRKDNELYTEERLENKRKVLEKKYKEDLELVERCLDRKSVV